VAHIICIANPDAVMETRRLILQRAGHEIHAVHNLKEMERACQTQQYDLAILADALPDMEKMRIADVIRKACPALRVLELHTGLVPTVSDADAQLQVSASRPEGLVEAVAAALKTSRKEKTQS